MTKAELIAAIAAAPDDADVYIDPGDDTVLRSRITVEVVAYSAGTGEDEIILGFSEIEPSEDAP